MWITGNWAAVAAGAMITFMDEQVVANNAHWTIHDAAAGTNAKVYKCEDTANNCLFYVHVNDNQADYAIIQLWEGWDAVGHAGTGQSLTQFAGGGTFYVRRFVGAWSLSLLDRRLIYIDMVNGTTWYCGQPRRFDESKNIVLTFSTSSVANYLNNMAYWINSSAGGGAFLFDESGNKPDAKGWGGSSSATYALPKGIDGSLHFGGELVIAGKTSDLAVGTLEGVIDLGAGASLNFTPAFGETIEIDGTDWVLISGSYAGTKYWSAIRKA